MPLSINDIRTKISEQELARWRAEFQQVHTPADLAERVQRFGDIVGDHAVDSSRAMFWRDAYLAATFGVLRKATRVQMLEPRKDSQGRIAPDFQIEIEGAWLRYETVEALLPGRQRSAEFREDREAGGGKARPDHIPDKAELISILSGAAEKKVGKAANYADCRGLVIMLSTWSLLGDEAQEQAFTSGTEEAGKVFDEVWVIKHSVAHRVWTGGHPAYRWLR